MRFRVQGSRFKLWDDATFLESCALNRKSSDYSVFNGFIIILDGTVYKLFLVVFITGDKL